MMAGMQGSVSTSALPASAPALLMAEHACRVQGLESHQTPMLLWLPAHAAISTWKPAALKSCQLAGMVPVRPIVLNLRSPKFVHV